MDYDAITLKYDASGTLLWSQTYAGAGNGPDALTCAVTDANNNVYVSGGTYASITQLTNMLLIKYNSTGTQQWASTWNNGTYNMQDASFRILLSGNYANCYGATQTSASPVTWKLANAQFYQSNGNLNGSSTSYGDNEDFAEVKDIIVESNYYVTACGYSTASGQGKNLKVTKFNQTLASIWNYTYNNTSNHDDVANSIELYGSLLYVGGYTTLADGTKDIVVAKLNYNIGTASWLTTHDGGTGENDEAIDLATDGTGQLYMCGNSYKVGNSDYYVAKLKNTTGDVLAQNRFNGVYNLNDIASNMVVTSTGDIYIAGQTGVSGASGNSYKYALTKWSEKTVWVPVPSDGYSPNGFYPNVGQLRNDNATTNTSVKFYNMTEQPCTFISDSLLSIVFASFVEDSTRIDTLSRVDLKWNKGNSAARVYPLKEQAYYMSFYQDNNKKMEQVHAHDLLVKQAAYTNTDIVYSHGPAGFRMMLVARNGAPTSDFEFQLTGQNSLSIDAFGNLIMQTSLGAYALPRPKAYSMNNTTGVLTPHTWQPSFVLTNNKVTFIGIGAWSGTLVLQMGKVAVASAIEYPENIEWSSYYGVAMQDFSCYMDWDPQKNIYLAGRTTTINFPVSLSDNPYLSDQGGNMEAFAVAFNQGGCYRAWGFIYGGTSHEAAMGVLHYDTGKLFITGKSSSENIYMEDGGDWYYQEYDPSVYGNGSIFMLIADPFQGFLSHSTQLTNNNGASYFRESIPLAKSEDGDLYVAATGQHWLDFPITGSGFSFDVAQPQGEQSRGMIMRFDSGGQLIWSTKFGSSTIKVGDMAYDNANNELYLVGSMPMSDNEEFPKVNPGSGYFFDNQTGLNETGSNHDAFIMRLNANNQITWSTYFGSSKEETCNALDFVDGILWIIGTSHTLSLSLNNDLIPLVQSSATAFFDTELGVYPYRFDSYIAKFVNGQLEWSTLVGGEHHDYLRDIKYYDNHVYVCGGTSSADFPVMELGGWYFDGIMNEDGTYEGEYPYGDAILMRFNNANELDWSTFFGGAEGQPSEALDQFYNLCFATNGVEDLDKRLFATGFTESYTNYPLWEYDTNVPIDWFDNFNEADNPSQAGDATVLRMATDVIIIHQETVLAKEQQQMLCFPNPAQTGIQIMLPATTLQKWSYTIFDQAGATVKIGILSGENNLIDVHALSNGAYHLILTSEGGEKNAVHFEVHQ